MDHDFFWYSVSAFVTEVLYKNKTYFDELNMKYISSKIENNIFAFVFKVNGINVETVYTFDSNVSIHGKLVIKNLDTKEANEFMVERRNESIRIGRDANSYHEIYAYLNKNYIDISIYDHKKIEVTNLNIVDEDRSGASVNIVNVDVVDNRVMQHNPEIEKLLFAVSGAIDLDKTICRDVICFRCSNLFMVIYDSSRLQVVSVDMKPSPKSNYASIFPVNSEYHQAYEYTLDEKEGCTITEYISTVEDTNKVRRKYKYIQDEKTGIITANRKKFAVEMVDNNITFARLAK